jgi:hypothetical protein
VTAQKGTGMVLREARSSPSLRRWSPSLHRNEGLEGRRVQSGHLPSKLEARSSLRAANTIDDEQTGCARYG